MAQVTINNLTASLLTYVNGQISVLANSSSSIQYGLLPYLALDPQFISDVTTLPLVLNISDGINTYDGPAAQNYVNQWIASGPPQNSNDPIAFTLAGMGFSVTADATLTSSTETPLLLLKNPNTSTVNARAMFFLASPESSTGIVTIKVYTNPTVTANGGALTISNNLVSSSAPSSAMNVYAGPTISSNGIKRVSLVSVANANTDLLNFAQTAILTPNNTLLVTVSVSNLGLLGSALTHFFMQWVEV